MKNPYKMGNISKDINATFSSERVKALINIKYTANWLDYKENEFLKPYKISVQQYNILRILRGAGKSLNVKTVKERMIYHSPNSTRLMDKLCEKKLIKRKRCDSDRRVIFVEILPKGLDLLNEINMKEFESNLSVITEKEAQILNEILDKLR